MAIIIITPFFHMMPDTIDYDADISLYYIVLATVFTFDAATLPLHINTLLHITDYAITLMADIYMLWSYYA